MVNYGCLDWTFLIPSAVPAAAADFPCPAAADPFVVGHPAHVCGLLGLLVLVGFGGLLLGSWTSDGWIGGGGEVFAED